MGRRRWVSGMTPPLVAPLLVAALALVGSLALAGCGTTSPAAGQVTSAPAPVDTPPTSSPAPADPPTADAFPSLAPATQDTPDVTAECVYRSTTGESLGISDSGFGLAGISFAPQPDSLCFFDGRSWWAVDLVDAPIRAAHLTGVGWFPSQVAHADGASGRLLFGMTNDAVDAIEITVDGIPVDPPIGVGHSAALSGVQILAQVPATGDVVVTAVGAGGTVLESVTARAES